MQAFCDTSESAFGAVVYARHVYHDADFSVSLLVSKSRVTPLKTVSIPRLELMAVVLSVKLKQTVSKVLQVDSNSFTLWSDSIDVLYWIESQSRQHKPFIANRIDEIQQLSSPKQWKHVPGKDNPADELSRGMTVKNLADTNRW